MKKNMKNLKKTVVAGLAAFMMLAESVTAFACTEAPHGNITPVSGVSGRILCFKHKIVEGYFQTHVDNGKGGCTVKTYYSTRCIYCNTIWMGDLYAIDEFTRCPHDLK